MKEINHRPDSDWGVISNDTLEVSKSPQPRVWVEDNFYDDPLKVREYALSQNFWDEGHGGVGWRTRKQFDFKGIKEKIEKIMSMKINGWTEEYPICGVFQAGFGNLKGIPPQVFHTDSQQWAAMVFLTPAAPFETGTKIVANKKSKVFDPTNQSNDLDEYFPSQKTFCDSTLYEDVDVMGNVFNRIVIFDGQCIHTSCGYFGDSFQNGRLWQMFFFDTVEKFNK